MGRMAEVRTRCTLNECHARCGVPAKRRAGADMGAKARTLANRPGAHVRSGGAEDAYLYSTHERRGFSFLRCDSVLVVTSTLLVPREHAAQGTSGVVVYRITLTASRHSDSVCAISHSHTAPLNSAVLATVSLGSLSASMSESIRRSTSFLICGGPGRTLMSQGRTQCTLRPRATPHPGPSLGRSATCRGRDFPCPAPRRTAPSPARPFPPGWRQPAWAHGGDERP